MTRRVGEAIGCAICVPLASTNIGICWADVACTTFMFVVLVALVVAVVKLVAAFVTTTAAAPEVFGTGKSVGR